MRKFLLLLVSQWLLIQFSYSQTSCSANFTFGFASQTPNEVRFVSVFLGDPQNTAHSWNFGDGNNSSLANPVHLYQSAGTYSVTHIVIHNYSNTFVCRDTSVRTVVIQSVCNLSASFSLRTDTANNRMVYFQNTSTPVNPTDSVRWSFGDGTTAGTYNAVHTYSNPGIYQVCMRIQQRVNGALINCAREVCNTVVIGNPCNLQAFYTYNSAPSSNSIFFSNASTGMQPGDTVRWSFGDGTTATGNNVSHTYSQPGNYIVCIRVRRATTPGTAPCVSEYCDTINVSGSGGCNLNPTFSIAPLNNSGNSFQFSNTTQGMQAGDSVRWFFGDGTSSSDPNPVHTYNQGGTYRVCLVIRRPATNTSSPCVREVCQQLTVSVPCNINPSFSYQADSSNAFRILFTNTTVSPVTASQYLWTFGDGRSSTLANPTHLYTSAGSYTVCLRVASGNNCVRTYCDTVVVNPGGCFVVSDFNFIRSTTDTFGYQFRPAVIDSNWSYQWNFGDGTSSGTPLAYHQYPGAGSYNVCLTVTTSPTCSSVTCRTVNVRPPVDCDSVRVSYVYRADAYTPNKIYFYTISNYPVISQTWTITRIPSAAGTAPVVLNSFNPIYYFRDTGSYRVCLRAYTAGGCIKDTCQIIYIGSVVQPSNPCYLQVYPNPAQSIINLSVFLNQPQQVTIQIFNFMNVLVRQRVVSGATGLNNYSVYVGDLMPGSYNVRITYGNNICYSRFLKL